MSRRIYILVIASVMIIASLFLLSCSKSPTDDGSGNNGLSILTVIPAHSAPGVLLSVSGFTIFLLCQVLFYKVG